MCGVLLVEGSRQIRVGTPKPNQIMKTKLTLFLSALSVVGVVSTATAGPGLGDFALRKQIADSQCASSVVHGGPVKYVANSSGKGGTVTSVREAGSTNIALFKSSKAKGCNDSACCAKR